MKVLVMGGTRLSGLALVPELVRHGHDLTIFNSGVSEALIPLGRSRAGGAHRQPTARWQPPGARWPDAAFRTERDDLNRSVMFAIDVLREDTGWEPDYTLPAMVEQTHEWYRPEGLDQSRAFDFG